MNKLVRFSYLHLHWGGSVDPFALIILWHWVWIPCTTSTLFRFIFELWFEKDKKTNRRGQDWADGSPCTSIFLNMVLSDSFRSFSSFSHHDGGKIVAKNWHLLGIRTRGRKMLSADWSTELWLPLLILNFCFVSRQSGQGRDERDCFKGGTEKESVWQV